MRKEPWKGKRKEKKERGEGLRSAPLRQNICIGEPKKIKKRTDEPEIERDRPNARPGSICGQS